MNREAIRGRCLEMMANPRLWPCYPILPLVRDQPSGFRDLGLLTNLSIAGADFNVANSVFLANMLFMPQNPKEFLKLPREEYPSFDAILDAGWRVD